VLIKKLKKNLETIGAYKIDGKQKTEKLEIHDFRTLDNTQEVN
jgi:hypothetical protein